MSKAVLAADKELIGAGKYHEAVTILRTLPEDPTAQKWLATLEAKYLPKAPTGPTSIGLTAKEMKAYEAKRLREAQAGKRPNRLRGCLVLLLLLGVLYVVSQNGRSSSVSRPTAVARATEPRAAGPAPTVTPSATITETPVPATAAPTLSLDDLMATSEAVRPALEQVLVGLPDLQSLTSVSAMQLADGWYVDVVAGIAPADDNEFTMPRILTAVEGVVQPIINLRVTTPQRTWLWENGEWKYVALGAARVPPTVTSIPITVAPVVRSQPQAQPGFVCPRNCDGAVAMGLSAQQAASCPGLDRDKDGVACYGD
jgi:hypothetical protein